jgi:hypothetical protein
MAGMSSTASTMSGERLKDPVSDRALDALQAALEAARAAISRELCDIPPPVPACDVNFNRLLEDRSRIADALQALGRLRATGPDRAAVLDFCRTVSGLDADARARVEALLGETLASAAR